MVKTAAIYNVFDGEELLRGSIEQIRNCVDVVIVVYQTISNYGEEYAPQIPYDLIDHHINYYPVVAKGGQWNEIEKRDQGLQLAKAMNCTHFILMDCDEYYEPEIFNQYKNKIIHFGYDSSVCRLYTYYYNPTTRIDPIEDYYCPFIHKIYQNSVIRFDKRYPAWVDPTRRTNNFQKLLKIENPIMHHYSWVRKDIARKLRNSSAKGNLGDINELIQQHQDFPTTGKMAFFKNRNYIQVGNTFNIDW